MNDYGGAARPSPALIAEATKRAGIIWVEVPGQDRARPAWHVWAQGPAPDSAAAYVLTGPGEQPLPGLAQAAQVRVSVPGKEPGDLPVTWVAAISRVAPGGAEWDAIIGQLVAGRLNAEPGPGGTSPAMRWAGTCVVLRLSPVSRARPEPG